MTTHTDERQDTKFNRLEEAISRTLDALREEFHRTASISTRQGALDLVAALFFAHVTSIDRGGQGIGEHLRVGGQTAATALNRFIARAFERYLLIGGGQRRGGSGSARLFPSLSRNDENFAGHLLRIFERDAGAFRGLHRARRDDLISAVFSRFMSTSFVDEKEMGQYLTPPEITRFMVEVAVHTLLSEARERLFDPAGNKSGVILDPSCGVGSFLVEAIRYCHTLVSQKSGDRVAAQWLSGFMGSRIVGIDKSERMIRLAMINLGLFGVKAVNLQMANALARSGPGSKQTRELEGRVELILTNPPFGATYGGTDIAGFAIGRGRGTAESEALFLERYVDWLAPGGVVVSIVPDSVLANRPVFTELRSLLRGRCSVEAVISLPPVTFGAAGTNIKTSILVLRKHAGAASQSPTFFGEALEVGFSVVTRSGQRRCIRNGRSDLPALLAAYRGESSATGSLWAPLAEQAARWDAAFHIGLSQGIAANAQHAGLPLLKVSDVADLIDDRIDPRRHRADEFRYVEISDVDIRTGLLGHKLLPATEAPERARKVIRAGDVLVSTVRPDRGAVAATPASLDGAVCSRAFAVLRCTGIAPLALVWLLKTEFVRRQMVRNYIGIAYPAINEASCLELVLPVTRENLGALSKRARALAEAQERFEGARAALLADVQEMDHGAANAEAI